MRGGGAAAASETSAWPRKLEAAPAHARCTTSLSQAEISMQRDESRPPARLRGCACPIRCTEHRGAEQPQISEFRCFSWRSPAHGARPSPSRIRTPRPPRRAPPPSARSPGPPPPTAASAPRASARSAYSASRRARSSTPSTTRRCCRTTSCRSRFHPRRQNVVDRAAAPRRRVRAARRRAARRRRAADRTRPAARRAAGPRLHRADRFPCARAAPRWRWRRRWESSNCPRCWWSPRCRRPRRWLCSPRAACCSGWCWTVRERRSTPAAASRLTVRVSVRCLGLARARAARRLRRSPLRAPHHEARRLALHRSRLLPTARDSGRRQRRVGGAGGRDGAVLLRGDDRRDRPRAVGRRGRGDR